ncbi:MAG: exodeoxyribonuclease VII small subunit [Desulfovibrionaceae bacterium]|nr:exodeoxyribonuclease VII small subunit [Desulfovibrionaceae bacterium]
MVNKELAGFEERLERLQQIVNDLDSGKLSLQKGMDLYQEGMDCAKGCRELLEVAKHQLSVWKEGQEKALDPDKLHS